ncbi:hypothetical protein BGV16_11135, partial [Clostridioides difficile]
EILQVKGLIENISFKFNNKKNLYFYSKLNTQSINIKINIYSISITDYQIKILIFDIIYTFFK